MSSGSSPNIHPGDTNDLSTTDKKITTYTHDRTTLRNNIIAASSGALITSLIVTPMDVVKNRLQAQQTNYQSLSKSIISELDCEQNPKISAQTVITETISPDGTTKSIKKTSTILTQSVNPKRTKFRNRYNPPAKGILNEYFNSQQLNLRNLRNRSSSSTYTHYEEVIKCSSFFKMNTGIMDIWCPRCNLNPSLSPAIRFTGIFDAICKITKYEGVRALWRGLSPSLLMAVPNTAIYFTGYEYLKSRISAHQLHYQSTRLSSHQHPYQHQHQHQPRQSLKDRILTSDSIGPLLSGTIARTASTTCISPLELIRTRAQTTSLQSHQPINSYEIFKKQFHQGGVRSLFTGLSSTLMRDVPFSAIYWVSIEKFRIFFYNLLHHRKYTFSKQYIAQDRALHIVSTPREQWITSFLSGGVSGMIAALATHPFDVVKTRKQMSYYQFPGSGFGDPQNLSMMNTFKKILHEEGRRGLFIGLTPRVTKVIPSCAIMLSSFDIMRKLLNESKHAI